jgi:ribosome maturation factor RimP
MTEPHPDFRRLVGRCVNVETGAGTITGTLLSCSPHSLWIVIDEQDVLVPLADVCQVLTTAA